MSCDPFLDADRLHLPGARRPSGVRQKRARGVGITLRSSVDHSVLVAHGITGGTPTEELLVRRNSLRSSAAGSRWRLLVPENVGLTTVRVSQCAILLWVRPRLRKIDLMCRSPFATRDPR